MHDGNHHVVGTQKAPPSRKRRCPDVQPFTPTKLAPSSTNDNTNTDADTNATQVGVCLTEPAVLDVGFFLEGGHRVLGCVRVNNLKLAAAEPLLLLDSAPPPPPPLEVFLYFCP